MKHPYFFMRVKRKYIRLNYGDIHYMESVGNYIKIHTESATYLTLLTIKELEVFLPGDLFCRINRGTIVSLHSIVSFDTDGLELVNNVRFTFGGKYKQDLENRVTILMSEDPARQNCLMVGPNGLSNGSN